MSYYPEHEKMKTVVDRSQAIGEFLEWLGEQGVFLGSFNTFNELEPVNENTQELLARFFEIDLDVIEKEKRHMLESIREEL